MWKTLSQLCRVDHLMTCLKPYTYDLVSRTQIRAVTLHVVTSYSFWGTEIQKVPTF
jgi:hypothetical protein